MKVFGAVLCCVLVASCGGGGGGGGGPPAPPPPPPTFTIGGTVSGLAGSGLTLHNNGGSPLAVSANGAFTFAGSVAGGTAYDVTVAAQPTSASQTCAVTAGSGAATANVTNIGLTCTTHTFPVSVTVEGLFGDLIFGELVLENGGDALTITANGTATFATNVASGAAYDITVLEQPNGIPQQTCTITGGTGTVGDGPVTGIGVSCRAPTGRFLYAATAAQGPAPAMNGVAAFTIDAGTGALTAIAGSPFAATGAAPRVAFFDGLKRFLYVYGDDDTTVPGGTTLTGFTVDTQTGALAPIANLLVDLPAAASPIAIHPSGNFFYVSVSDGAPSANNQLYGFAIEATTGELAALPGFPWGPFGANEVLNSAVLSPDGDNLYLATSTPPDPPLTSTRTGTIRQLAVDAQTGALNAVSQFTDAANTFNQLFIHPDGTRMYTRNAESAGLILDQYTSRFTFDSTGAIAARFDITSGFGMGVVFAPLKRTVYVPVFGGTFAVPAPGSVVVLHDSTPLNNDAGSVEDSPFATGGSNSLAPVLDPTHRFLALTNIGSQDVSLMRIRRVDDSLTQVPGSPYKPEIGTAPSSVTFDPSGRFAYLTDASTNSIASYEIDLDTGEPTFVSSQPAGGSPGPAQMVILGSQ